MPSVGLALEVQFHLPDLAAIAGNHAVEPGGIDHQRRRLARLLACVRALAAVAFLELAEERPGIETSAARPDDEPVVLRRHRDL